MKKLGFRLRDVIFGGMGTFVLYHEVVVSSTAEPLLIFAAFFLLGLIPASRADDTGSLNFKDMLREWLNKDDDSKQSHRSNKEK